MAEPGSVFEDALTHAPVRVHDMREPWQPFNACFREGEAQTGKALGDARADDGEKSHQEGCAIRISYRHEKILEQSREGEAFKSDVHVNGRVQSLRSRPGRV